jgi:hypothetical protein
MDVQTIIAYSDSCVFGLSTAIDPDNIPAVAPLFADAYAQMQAKRLLGYPQALLDVASLVLVARKGHLLYNAPRHDVFSDFAQQTAKIDHLACTSDGHLAYSDTNKAQAYCSALANGFRITGSDLSGKTLARVEIEASYLSRLPTSRIAVRVWTSSLPNWSTCELEQPYYFTLVDSDEPQLFAFDLATPLLLNTASLMVATSFENYSLALDSFDGREGSESFVVSNTMRVWTI